MAIERTTINGDFDALKTALETLVPAYFGSVTISQSGAGRTITCKDADNNTIFYITGSTTGTTPQYTAYRTGSSGLQTTTTKVDYFYKVGVNGAFLTLKDNNYGRVIAIAKAANGKTAIVLPGAVSGVYTIQAACWGDDAAYYNPLYVAATTNSMTGNNCQMVPVPLYGNYQTANSIPKVFYLPMAQANMRGVVQEITSDSGLYITDGYIAMLYDAGDE